jgi:hypothetical protein
MNDNSVIAHPIMSNGSAMGWDALSIKACSL